MGGRPCPSTSEVTRARSRQEEWPYPGSHGRHTSWTQHNAQRSATPKNWQRHTAKLAITRKHTPHSVAEQSKAVYHNDGGGQPHHPPQAPAPAQHPTPSVGARPTTRALHPRTATSAHKQGAHASLKGKPRGLDSAPPMGGRPYPSASEVTRTRPPQGERPCPGSRGHHASRRQRSAQRGGTSTNTSQTPNTQGGGQTHHTGTSPTHSHRPRKQGTHVEHHQEPKTPHPNANTAPTTHATTKATLTHNIEGMLP